jgi:cold shock CspA family protein
LRGYLPERNGEGGEAKVAQGTIKDYDHEQRIGSVLLDDRTEIGIDATSVEGSGILNLRVGQRVVFEVAEEGGQKLARGLKLISFS